MATLEMIKDHDEGEMPKVYVIVVPGVAGANLNERTCPHFSQWLDRLVADCKSRAQSWVYKHHLEIAKLESWDSYSSTGEDLLARLISMQRDQHFDKDDTLIMIGHKLGCYILKKALVEACKKEHRPEVNQFLDMIDTIVMVGEPNLHADNQWEWSDLISKCVSVDRPLPEKLASDLSVGVFQHITDIFEDERLYSTYFEVSGNPRSKSRHRWKFKRTVPDGCICSVTLRVRLSTTASEETMLDKDQGDDKVCTFHPKSSHYQNLLMVNNTFGLAQMLEGGESDFNTTICDVKGDAGVDQEDIFEDHSITDAYHPQPTTSNRMAPSSSVSSLTRAYEIDGQVSHQLESEYVNGNDENLLQESAEKLSTSDTGHSTKPGEFAAVSVCPHDRDAVRNEQNTKRQRKRKPALSASIPRKDKHFFGRDSILALLHRGIVRVHFASDEGCIQQKTSNITWLTGPGGIGKTAIAVEHLYRSMDKIDHVFWLNASSPAHLGRYCHDFAVVLGLVNGRINQDHDASRIKFLEWLTSSGKTFLLVFDDLAAYSNLDPYLPRCGNGVILVTSRLEPPQNAGDATMSIIKVPPLDNVEAARFLYHKLFHGKVPDQAKDLCFAANRSRGLPLTLHMLVKWSLRLGLDISGIGSMLRAAEHSMNSGRDLSLRPLVYASTLEKIVSLKVNELDTAEACVFDVLCFFDPEGVQDRILLGAQRSRDLPLRFFPRDSQALIRTMDQLWKDSLIEVNESKTSTIVHRTVQEAAKASMGYERWNNALQTASALVQTQWPSERKLHNIVQGFWPEFDALHSHVHSLARSCFETKHELRDPNDDFKRLLIRSTWYNSIRGNQVEDRELVHLAWTLYSTSTHGEDRKVSNPLLPTRCLDVGSTTAAPHLVDAEGRQGPYVALSWVWEDQPTSGVSWKLTQNNMASFKRGINVNDLPITVRDAISVTRNLGCRYLWIDALCILQDSSIDKIAEILHMADYYANSAVTIAESRSSTAIQRFPIRNDAIFDCEPYCIYKMPRIHDDPPGLKLRGWQFHALQYWGYFRVPGTSKRVSYLNGSSRPIVNGRDSATFDGTITTHGETKSSEMDEEIRSIIEELSSSDNEHQVNPIPDAQNMLNKGRDLMLQNSYVEAAATLVLSRDMLGVPSSRQEEVLQLYGQATALLGTAYHLQHFGDIALRILKIGGELYSCLTSGKISRDIVYGRILLSIGVCLLGMGKTDESQENLEHARLHLVESNGEQNEWSASIDIKLSDCHVAAGVFAEARTLLQSAMNYFQAGTSENMKRQVARVLHRQSVLYEAEGNRMMHNIMAVAAREALAQVLMAGKDTDVAVTSPQTLLPLSQAVFDELVEPWFR